MVPSSRPCFSVFFCQFGCFLWIEGVPFSSWRCHSDFLPLTGKGSFRQMDRFTTSQSIWLHWIQPYAALEKENSLNCDALTISMPALEEKKTFSRAGDSTDTLRSSGTIGGNERFKAEIIRSFLLLQRRLYLHLFNDPNVAHCHSWCLSEQRKRTQYNFHYP